nr:hypothetical protein [Delftia sp. PE138]
MDVASELPDRPRLRCALIETTLVLMVIAMIGSFGTDGKDEEFAWFAGACGRVYVHCCQLCRLQACSVQMCYRAMAIVL